MHFNYLGGQWEEIRETVLKQIDETGFRGDYIGGKKVKEFEDEFANYFDTKYAVGISNGTDALKIALQILDLGKNDLVVIPTNTFVADYLAVRNLPSNEKPQTFFIDQDEYFNINLDDLEIFLNNERNLFGKVVIMAVHLYGHPCDMDRLNELKNKHELLVIEDCSQSHGTKYKGRFLGNDGDISVYSLYPGKNLGAIGDAGILTTNNIEFFERAKSLRNYGSKVKYYYDEIGHNHRLDTVQAIVLSEKLKRLKDWNDNKNKVAGMYLDKIKNTKIMLPKNAEYCDYHSYHIFHLVIDDRQNFINYMSKNDIPTIIHYPIVLHKTNIYQNERVISSKNADYYADKIVSIPIHPFMDENEVEKIINLINKY